LMFNLVMIVSGTLIRGGVLSIRLQQIDDIKRVSISASGPTLKWSTDQEQTLQGKVALDDVTPYTVQGFYTRQLADQLGAELQINSTDQVFEIVALQHQPELVE
jgi:histidine phosphotransferase ChpT